MSTRKNRSLNAWNWYNHCKSVYSEYIEKSVESSRIINDAIDENIIREAKDIIYQNKEISLLSENIKVLPTDTVTALFSSESDNICVLNFASYKNPGGKFLQGSMAQEEYLCHHSILYNVLCHFTNEYYKKNLKSLNYGMYSNRLIYSKDILFADGFNVKFADVITCAAPNKLVLEFNNYENDYLNILDEEFNDAMLKRIYGILKAASDMNKDTIILGAFGCGVFKNNPVFVSNAFKAIIYSGFRNKFKEIIFAIIQNNFDEFYDCFNK